MDKNNGYYYFFNFNLLNIYILLTLILRCNTYKQDKLNKIINKNIITFLFIYFPLLLFILSFIPKWIKSRVKKISIHFSLEKQMCTTVRGVNGADSEWIMLYSYPFFNKRIRIRIHIVNRCQNSKPNPP